MSGPPFQIPGLGHAKPNEHLPADSFAPDLLAAAASICGSKELTAGSGATQWTRQTLSKEEEQRSPTAISATERPMADHAPPSSHTEANAPGERKEDAMEVDKVEEPTAQQAERPVTDSAADDAQIAPGGGKESNAVLSEAGEQAVTVAQDEAHSGQHVAHALEAALDGLLSAAMVENDEPAPMQSRDEQGAAGAEQVAGSGEHPEWEVDSSPYESSDSDSSDSSSDDSEDEEGYEPLGLEETARLLMAEVDGDGAGKGGKGAGGQIRTKNEISEHALPKPDVAITPEMKIDLLGVVEFVVESTVVIRSKIPGEMQVLDSGTVLCKEDRTVIGALAETLGTVKSPLYTVGFSTEEEVGELGLVVGSEVFYSVEHAKYVFTQALREVKGSDASNLHDEEVAPDEMEFSDDEKEAEYKKQLKAKKRGGKAGRGGHNQPHPLSHSSAPPAPDTPNGSLNYDEEEDGPYRPLSRPPEGGFSLPRGGHGHRGSLRGGRENRGRGGRGGRGDRRQGRGGGHGPYGSPDAPRPSSYAVPPHLPPSPFGAVVPPPPPVSSSPWPSTSSAPYAAPAPQPPHPPVPYSHGQSTPQPAAAPSAATFNFNYQAWDQGQTQPYQYPQQVPQQPAHHQLQSQQPTGSGYSAAPAWPGAGVPTPPAPTGAYVNPAFFGGLQGQQAPAQQGQQHQPYWGHGGYGQPPK